MIIFFYGIGNVADLGKSNGTVMILLALDVASWLLLGRRGSQGVKGMCFPVDTYLIYPRTCVIHLTSSDLHENKHYIIACWA